ncbi:MAG: peptidoglycan recognition family protein [Planctomycetota bacterium]
MTAHRTRVLTILGLCFLTACSTETPSPEPGDPLKRQGDEIVVAGQFFHTGTKVVLWMDPLGYDAYRPHRAFSTGEGPSGNPSRIARFGSFRRKLPEDLKERVAKRGWTREDLAKVVSQVVIHFDACGTSRRCFEVLHDIRGLSSHFMIDLDGTVYQTLDLKERAWHAAQANDQSVGIEIAHIGAHEDPKTFADWYSKDEKGLRVTVPEKTPRGHLPEDFVGRPPRQDLFESTINSRKVKQHDFTEKQYAALEKLLVTLCRVFPKVKAEAPRAADGSVLMTTLPSDEVLFAFEGLVAHHHISKGKIDPGPAFDWDRVLGALRSAGIPHEKQ